MSPPKVEKLGYNRKEGKIVAESKGMSEWVMLYSERKLRYINTFKEAQSKK